MSDGILTQEEIDALLNSASLADELEKPARAASTLDAREKEAVGEAVSLFMDAGASTLTALVEKAVEISNPVMEIIDLGQFLNNAQNTYVIGNTEFISGLAGAHAIFMQEKDAVIIADLMMGGSGQSEASVEDKDLDALREAFNQMMNAGATAISSVIRESVQISPPDVEAKDLSVDELGGYLGQPGQTLVRMSFRLIIEGMTDSELSVLYPFGLAKSMAAKIIGGIPEQEQQAVEAARSDAASARTHDGLPTGQPSYHGSAQNSGAMPPAGSPYVQQVPVQPVQFAPLQPAPQAKDIANIDLIMDIPLQITVELGKTKKTIREILALGPGSVIELDKLAGEPVDLLVNGKLLAKGEVVVIDENFGIRVSDIISPIERISNLQ